MLRRLPVLLAWFVPLLAACSDTTTLAGTESTTGSDGALVVYRTPLLPGGLERPVILDPATGAEKGLATWLPVATPSLGPASIGSITFSRNGDWMAWVETRYDPTQDCLDQYWDRCFSDRPNEQLFVSRVGSSGRTLLTPQYNYDTAPTFSPDGSRLAFLRGYFGGDQQMMTIARDGSGLAPVLQRTPRGRQGPDWSPTNSRIVYYQPDVRALYRVSANGKDHVAITEKNAVYGNPAWSPDGTRIAVTVIDNSGAFAPIDAALAILNADGVELKRVAYGSCSVTARPVWSPDGTRIAYCADEPITEGSGRYVVRILDVATGVSRTITPPGYTDWRPIWRP